MTPTVVVTRPLGPYLGVDRLLTRIAAEQVQCIHLPMLRIEPLPLTPEVKETLEKLSDRRLDWVVFLSPTAVHVARELISTVVGAESSSSFFNSIHIAAQGPGTTAAVHECFGRAPDFVPRVALAEQLAEEFADFIVAHSLSPRGIALFQARDGRDVVAPALLGAGLPVQSFPVYATVEVPISEVDLHPLRQVESGDVHFLFLSPSAVKAASKVLTPTEKAEVQTICIGPITGRAARDAQFSNIFEAQDHTEDGLVQLLLTRLKSRTC